MSHLEAGQEYSPGMYLTLVLSTRNTDIRKSGDISVSALLHSDRL